MIEINLLPPQERPVERTPLPVFLSLIGGLLALAATVSLFFWVGRSLSKSEDRHSYLKAEVKDAKARSDRVKQLRAEVKEAEERIDTLLLISQRKIFWSRKLDQLVVITPDYIWYNRIAVEPPQKNEPAFFALDCNSRGREVSNADEFLKVLQASTNFAYHFDLPVLSPVQRANPNEVFGRKYLVPWICQFQVKLPVKDIQIAKVQPQPKK